MPQLLTHSYTTDFEFNTLNSCTIVCLLESITGISTTPTMSISFPDALMKPFPSSRIFLISFSNPMCSSEPKSINETPEPVSKREFVSWPFSDVFTVTVFRVELSALVEEPMTWGSSSHCSKFGHAALYWSCPRPPQAWQNRCGQSLIRCCVLWQERHRR